MFFVKRRFSAKIWLVMLCLLFVGCSSIGVLKTHFKGGYYLENEQYEDGVASLYPDYLKNPDDPTINYYLGRFYLAEDQAGEALKHMKQAVRYQPDDADYQFWLGVAYWSAMDSKNERKCYEKAIAIDPDYMAAYVYLGHNFLDAGNPSEALKNYDKALKIYPYQPEALYNRAVALQESGRRTDELNAWKQYLKYYPDGSLARDATAALNSKGDFTYRNYAIGPRLLTLEWVQFEKGDSTIHDDAKPSLHVVGSMLESNKALSLVIESYYKGDESLAKERADSVKRFILNAYSDVEPDRITARFFGRPERVLADKKIYYLDSSIVFKTVKK